MTTGTAAPAISAAADALVNAALTGEPVPPVRELLVGADVATAYAVQRDVAARAMAAGRRVIGRKIGLTSAAVQRQLGVDTPDFGVLFDDMLCPPDRPVETAGLLQPRIEAEIAFVLRADLVEDTSPAAVRAATESVVAAFEIVDSRIAGWDITLVDTIADNASSGRFVLGSDRRPLDELDLRTITMSMSDATGRVVSTGSGADCLGDPVEAVAWLAATLRDLGDPLRAGDVVLSGALGPMVAVLPGSAFTAVLDGLGTVAVVFDGGTEDDGTEHDGPKQSAEGREQ